MALKTLKPSIKTLATSGRVLQPTPRLRGRAGVERRAKWLEMHPLCVHCEAENPPRTTAATEVDHIRPLELGGAENETNLQSLCAEHHARKTASEAIPRTGYR